MYWETEPFGMEQGGCAYTCHTYEGSQEYVRTSGHIFVNEEGMAGEADQWNILAKHGYGWPQWHDDIYYCSQCHEAHDEAWIRAQSLHGDAGRMPYRRNGLNGPTYIELNPVNWADAVTLTEAEIADGEAVMVASLTPAEITEIWARYEAVNALIPELILQAPSGSQADIRVAARWADGEWTIELKRAMVTGYEDDVQFDDLTQRYVMSMTAITGLPHGGELSTGLDPTAVIVYFEIP